MRRERALKVVLVLVGLLFCAGIYPLFGSLLHPADSDTGDTMMVASMSRSESSCSSRCGIHRRIAAWLPSRHGRASPMPWQCRFWDSKFRLNA
jgi:hypothetical protein